MTDLLRFKTFSFDHLESDASVRSHTGITSKKTFEVLWQWLEPAEKTSESSPRTVPTDVPSNISQDEDRSFPKVSSKRKIHLRDEFFMVLLRLGLYEEDLAFRFGVSTGYVSLLLSAWLPFLRAQLSGLIRWPRTRVVPQWDILMHFPNTVAAIDCTEISLSGYRGLKRRR